MVTQDDFQGTHFYIEKTNPVFQHVIDLYNNRAEDCNYLLAKLDCVFSSVAMSKMSSYQRDRFLNLWIALESLLRTGNYKNNIDHVKKVLPAIMCRRYFYRLLRNLAERICCAVLSP